MRRSGHHGVYKNSGVSEMTGQPIRLYPSSAPGPCGKCRHANHGTDDFINFGLVACKFGLGDRAHATCDKQLKDKDGNLVSLCLFEPYDGNNCTWFHVGPMEVIPPAASSEK